MLKTKLLATICVAFSLLLFQGCSKDKDATDLTTEEKEEIMSLALDFFLMDGKIFSDALNSSDNPFNTNPDNINAGVSSLNPGGAIMEITGDCPVINTEIIGNNEMTYTVDFGTGCKGIDGIQRSGKIELKYTLDLQASQMTLNITYTKFSLMKYTLNGTYQVKQIGETKQILNGKYSIEKEGVGITNTEIASETVLTDNQYVHKSSGSAVFNNDNKELKWKFKFTEPGILPLNCNYFTSGIIKFSLHNDTHVGTLNYGNGSCDSEAILNINGKERIINLD
jgi:hypothetical protein